MTMRRRRFLQTTGATVFGAGVLSGRALAAHYDAQPEHVTISYDQSVLEQYRPELVVSEDARSKFLGLYGWVARSPEYDTDVCVYWCSYSHQEGWVGNLDSHWGDHEPLQVEVNSETGEIERIRASVYHWIKGETPASEASLKNGHPHLKVVDPWHQFTAASAAGTLPEVKDLTAVFQDWLEDGLEGALHPGSSTNPWQMESRSDWWRREYGVSTDALIVNAYKTAGLGTIGQLEGDSTTTDTDDGGTTETTISALNWGTASDWDNAVSEYAVAHADVSNSDYTDSTMVQKGLPYGTSFGSPVGIFPNDIDDSTLYDVAGVQNATLSGTVTTGVTGDIGTSGVQYGGGQAELASNSAYDKTSLTFVAVFKTSSATPYAGVMQKTDGSGHDFSLRQDDSNGTALQIYDSSGSAVATGSTDITDGAYHVAVAVLNGGTGNSYLYIDGAEDASGTAQSPTNNWPIYFGVNENGGGESFNGVMAYNAIHDTALSQAQAQELSDALLGESTLTTQTQSFNSAKEPNLENLDYSLNGQSMTVDVIGSPGTADEEVVSQSLDGAASYTLSWSASHTDFRLRPRLNTTDPTTTSTFSGGDLA